LSKENLVRLRVGRTRAKFVLALSLSAMTLGACNNASNENDQIPLQAQRPSDCHSLSGQRVNVRDTFAYINMAGVGWSFFVDRNNRVLGAMEFDEQSVLWPNRSGNYEVLGEISLYHRNCSYGDIQYDGIIYVNRMIEVSEVTSDAE
jgi:hypothetical protein